MVGEEREHFSTVDGSKLLLSGESDEMTPVLSWTKSRFFLTCDDGTKKKGGARNPKIPDCGAGEVGKRPENSQKLQRDDEKTPLHAVVLSSGCVTPGTRVAKRHAT